MAYERYWAETRKTLTANGATSGILTVADTTGLFVRQQATLSATGTASLDGEIKEVLSSTQFRFGPANGNIPGTAYDCSVYTTALSSLIFTPKQAMVYSFAEEATHMAYDTEPIRALRVTLVDPQGNYAATEISSVSVSNTINVSVTGSQATFQYAKVANTVITASNNSVTTAYLIMTTGGASRVFTAVSTMDQYVGVSVNGTQVTELGNGESYSIDLASNGRSLNASSTIGLWNISTTSATGTVRISTMY